MSKPLPPNPSFEQLKKQAKDLHRGHQAGDAEAISRLRAHLPKLSRASEETAAAAEVSLQEAQHALAREYGFPSWNWLRATVEVDFDLLARLTPRELLTLLREVEQKDVIAALSDAGEEVKQALLGQMSVRVRTFILQEIQFVGKVDPGTVRDTQRRILRQAALLAEAGHLAWPDNDVRTTRSPAERSLPAYLLELVGRELDELTPEELAMLLSGLAEKARSDGILSLEPVSEQCASPYVKEGLRLLVDGTEPALIAEILKQRSEHALLPRLRTRYTMLLQGLTAIAAGDSPPIVHHKFGALYRTEPSEPLGDLPEASADDLLARLRGGSWVRLDLEQLDALLTDMAFLARRESVAALRPLIEATGDPLFAHLLGMVCDGVEPTQVAGAAEGQIRDAQDQAQHRHRMVIAGIRAIQEGKTPMEVSNLVRFEARRRGGTAW